MRARSLVLVVLTSALGASLTIGACASDTSSGEDDASAPAPSSSTGDSAAPRDGATTSDAATSEDASRADGATTSDASFDAAACGDGGSTSFPPGDTCAPFGEGTPCGGGCFPTYGYVCLNGGPPNIGSCVQARSSTLGGTYCCPTLACVRSSFEDTKCAGKPGKPRYYACPVDAQKNLRATPPGACEEVTGPEYRFFCCPS